MSPHAVLTSSCQQIIHNHHLLSWLHSIALDFQFSLQGAKSSFVLVWPWKETPQELLVPAGTQINPQRHQPKHSAPKIPKTPQIPATGEHHRNTEQGGDCWANPLACQDPELSACELQWNLIPEQFSSEENLSHTGELCLEPDPSWHLFGCVTRAWLAQAILMALGVLLLLVPSGGGRD